MQIALDKPPEVKYTVYSMKGEELRAIREKLGWFQAQMAAALGVTANTVARWERNEVPIREPIARLIKTVAASKKKTRR